LGARGLFWEIMTQSMKKWPGFKRVVTPWWAVTYFCTDVKQALIDAPMMVTEMRVRAFGTPVLNQIFDNMFLEDFQQEYECMWVDETTSWLSWDIIKRNQDPNLTWVHATNVDEALAAVDTIRGLIRSGRVEPVFVGGVDIGRHRHLTELMVLGKTTDNRLPLRMSVSLDRVEFADQEECLYKIITSLPFIKVLIDQSGLGMQLSENLTHRTSMIAEGVTFTNPLKELWAVGARIAVESARVPIPMDREIAYQFHSIKKKALVNMNVFDTARNEKHHADKFWAWALAVFAGGLEPEAHDDDIIVHDERVSISDF
jgi:phage FluMu gp28-like protein